MQISFETMKIAKKLLFGILFCALSTTVLAQKTVKHEVQSGETLYSLARNYGVTVDAIKQANTFIEGENIIAGQVITIPNATKSGTATTTSSSTPTAVAPAKQTPSLPQTQPSKKPGCKFRTRPRTRCTRDIHGRTPFKRSRWMQKSL